VLLTSPVLAQLNQLYPGWKSASAAGGGVFAFDVAPKNANHTVVVTISTSGALGAMQFTYTVDGGAVQGPITSVAQTPNGPLNEFLFVYVVPGTDITLVFQGGGPSPNPLNTFPLNATFTIASGGTSIAITGAPASPALLFASFSSSGTTTTLNLDTLASTVAGDQLLASTGVGLGWSLATVANDSTNVVTPGWTSPTLPATTRAVAGFTGYTGTGNDSTTYVIAGRSFDGAKVWWAPTGGLAQFYTTSSLSTLGAASGQTLVEVVANSPADDKGQWRIFNL